jgi:hypothetical protein
MNSPTTSSRRTPRFFALWLAVVVSAAAACEKPETGSAAPSGEAAITEDTLYASESSWPYHVALVEPWTPPGGERAISAGIDGVVIRVLPDGRVRIDFGRDGVHEVPVAATDVVDRANGVATGTVEKLAPNFRMAMGTRIFDAETGAPHPFDLQNPDVDPAYLCVFADTKAERFEAIAEALAPLEGRAGVRTLVFPQAERYDRATVERLRELDWPVFFALGFLAKTYNDSLLSPGTELPAVLLATDEGRLLYESTWGPDVAEELAAVIDRELGGAAQ